MAKSISTFSTVNRFSVLEGHLESGTRSTALPQSTPQPQPQRSRVLSSQTGTDEDEKGNGASLKQQLNPTSKSVTQPNGVVRQTRVATPPLKKASRRNSLRVVRQASANGTDHHHNTGIKLGMRDREVVPKKTDWEIPRKSLHASIGFLVLYLHSRNPQTLWPLLKTLFSMLVVITTTDALRFSSQSFNLLYIQVCGPLMRQSEEKSWNGVIWYLLGCLGALGIYPRDVAVISVLTLSWSDTAASTIGRLLSPWSSALPDHVPILGIPFARRKSLAGFLAACVTGFCIGTWWWWNGKNVDGGWGDAWGGNRDLIWWTGERLGSWRFLNAQSKEMLVLGKPIRLWMTASVLGVVGAVVEAIDIGLDDNLTLPILTGGIMWLWLTIMSAI